jgi:hypothetical protein
MPQKNSIKQKQKRPISEKAQAAKVKKYKEEAQQALYIVRI